MRRARLVTMIVLNLLSFGLFLSAPPMKDRLGYTVPLVMLGALTISSAMAVLASRLDRDDVSDFEKSARRLFFKKIDT